MLRRGEAKPAKPGDLQTDGRRSAILRDLGRSPEERPVFSLPSPLLPWAGLVVGAFVAFCVQALVREGPVGALLAAAMGLFYAVIMLYPRKLVVGEDGLLLVWIFSRFIPYRDIAYVETSDGFYFANPGINIALRSGKAVDFATSVFKERWAERDALLTLIRLATEEARAKRARRAPESLLRGGKEPIAWARALRTIGAGANVDPRTPPVPADELLRVAESPGASIVDRTAAFAAIAASQDPEAIKKLRIAADRTADPAAKEVLQAAIEAGGDEHELASVLVEAEERAARR